MHEAARKISFPVERKNETQSKNTMEITGVPKEKVWIELRKATKRAPHKAVSCQVYESHISVAFLLVPADKDNRKQHH